MPLFDQNQWYQISVGTFKTTLSMAGTSLNSGGHTGAVFFQITNTSAPLQRWQLFPSVNSTYILRSAASGPTAYLGVYTNTSSESQTGGTTAVIENATFAGDEVYWNVESFKDGYFSLNNLANGSDWNLFVKDAGTMAMSNNITGEQEGQKFNFTKLGVIDDRKFSMIQTPVAATTSVPPSRSTSSSRPSSSSPPSSDLSTGASIGIGVSVGVVALIALLSIVFFLLRRRRSRRAQQQRTLEDPVPGTDAAKSTTTDHDYPQDPKYGHQQPWQYQQGYHVPEQQHLAEVSGEEAGPGRQELGAQEVEMTAVSEMATGSPVGAKKVPELGTGSPVHKSQVGDMATRSPVELAGDEGQRSGPRVVNE